MKVMLNTAFKNNITLKKSFEEFQKYSQAKNLSSQTIKYYDDCYTFFRRVL